MGVQVFGPLGVTKAINTIHPNMFLMQALAHNIFKAQNKHLCIFCQKSSEPSKFVTLPGWFLFSVWWGACWVPKNYIITQGHYQVGYLSWLTNIFKLLLLSGIRD